MAEFNGFQPGKPESMMIPQGFSSELLPQIDDLGELKLMLFCFRALSQREGKQIYLRLADFQNDAQLMAGLAVINPDDAGAVLAASLAKTVQRGALLAADVTLEGKTMTLYFINTARGRQAVEQIKLGNWQPGLSQPIEILPERPNVFALYEANIGPLTGIIMEKLKDALEEYGEAWIIEATAIAVESNKRSWRYIDAILKRWQEEGKHNAPHQENPEPDNFTKYADIINT